MKCETRTESAAARSSPREPSDGPCGSGRPARYFTETRWDLVELVGGSGRRVLEIGCGVGNTGQALKRCGKAVEVVGIECEPDIARQAAAKLDRVLTANVEDEDLALPREYFDCILAGDVLEHLHNPWTVVRRLASCLKTGGQFIASVPNIRHWRVLRNLVCAGRWEYTENGTLDRTHLRFFTKRSLALLFDPACFVVERIVPRFLLGPRSKSRICHRMTLGLLEEFLTFQYLVVARRI